MMFKKKNDRPPEPKYPGVPTQNDGTGAVVQMESGRLPSPPGRPT
jgi:hypothetical protein